MTTSKSHTGVKPVPVQVFSCKHPLTVDLSKSWFGFFFSGQYLSLDTDHNGMLSKEELAR